MEAEVIRGYVDSIRFQNADTGWTVAYVVPEEGGAGPSVGRLEFEKPEAVTVVGVMPGLSAGVTAEFKGQRETTKYGEQVKVTSWEEVRPSDVRGIERYLASGLIKNIGPEMAARIVEVFGEETLDIIDNAPERLVEVKGIGKKRAKSIAEAAVEQRTIRDVMIWMKRYALPNGLAMKIYGKYGNASMLNLRENPYRLADDFEGIGFKKSDQVALSIGIPKESKLRVECGIRAVLKDAAEAGSTCLPYDVFLKRASSQDYLDVSQEVIIDALIEMTGESLPSVVEEDGFVMLATWDRYEKRIAERLTNLARGEKAGINEVDVDAIEAKAGIRFAEGQKEAIRTALSRGLMILTGGPGTGKTVTTKAIIAALEDEDQRVLLAAPTGRAAKRMTEVTGRYSQTIHRLLEYQGGFMRNRENPLKGDALIVDESSMIDVYLLASLLDAVPYGMKVIFVGDVDQLPSVGPGTVLKDMIESGVLPTVRLTEIFRQAQDSEIIMGAHAVNVGRMPRLDNRPGTDFWFVERNDVQKIQDTVHYLVEKHIPGKLGFPQSDIQVLTPMRKESDPVGATQLNRVLQDALNPSDEKIVFGNMEFRVGDRVMQTKNDYVNGVFNGDLGEVVCVDDEDGTLTVSFEGVPADVEYKKADLVNLDLAYATTIHKSQGSEYPVIVIPIHRGQYVMLNRNLLYTGITRARKCCILVGTRDALAMAVSREDASKRYTRLAARLASKMS